MTKIKNQEAYPLKIPIATDTIVGNDSENDGKTVSFQFDSFASFVNSLNGSEVVSYTFGTSPIQELDENGYGFFLSENNITNPATVTKLFVSKKLKTLVDLSPLYDFITGHNDEFILQLRNSADPNNFIYFNIISVVEDEFQYTFQVSVYKNDNYIDVLKVNNLYVFNFSIKSDSIDEFSKVVYFNNTNPAAATIFDLNNPPTVNDNSLKADVANLYIGTDASTWVYKTTTASYQTKTITTSLSNFYLAGTTMDAGSNKTTAIERPGTVGGAPATAANHFVVKAQTDLLVPKFIKSNESLTGATRKGNTLYGILDQYTGEQIILNKISFTPSLVDSIIYFQLGSEYFKRQYFDGVKITWFGAIGDGTTNNITAINKAVTYVMSLGSYGETIIVPVGKFITDYIDIPRYIGETGNVVFKPVIFRGEGKPSQLYGTVGSNVMGDSGAMLICNSTTSGKSVIRADAPTGQFSDISLQIYNLDIRTYNNPIIGGVDGGNAQQMLMRDVQISTNIYSTQASNPTTTTSYGLVTPNRGNAALTDLQNVSISGYYEGIIVNEHTVGNDLNVTCCKNAMTFKVSDHSTCFSRLCLQRNQTNLNFPSGLHYFVISELNIEHATAGQTDANNAWQLTTADIRDVSNFGRGRLLYNVVKGGVGEDSTFTVLGANSIAYSRIALTSMSVISGFAGGEFFYHRNDNSASRIWKTRTDATTIGGWSLQRETGLNTNAYSTVIDSNSLGQVAFITLSPIVPNATLTTQAVNLGQMNTAVSGISGQVIDAGATLSLGFGTTTLSNYVFTGTTATWTLPNPVGNSTKSMKLINIGSGTVTVNTNAGATIIYNGVSPTPTSTYALVSAANIELYCDGTRWYIMK